jgi:diadenosine tetraphosphatase ApaH/serine/threonine PP2A family protein phosphatase
LPQVQFVHGSPIDEDEYVVTPRDALEPLMATAVPLTFFGHSHVQGAFSSNPSDGAGLRPVYKTAGQTESAEMQLREGVEYLINPGSVGQPRDGDWRAAFAVFDAQSYTVSFHRAPYDLKSAQDRILAAHLPQRLATRLAAGR